MRCKICSGLTKIDWNGICDRCKLNEKIEENKLLREALINEIENKSAMKIDEINKYIDEIVLKGKE